MPAANSRHTCTSISCGRNRPPLPTRMLIRRRPSASLRARTWLSLRMPGKSSCLSMTTCGKSSTRRWMTATEVCTPADCGKSCRQMGMSAPRRSATVA
ncbi:Uncharacterised protein [Bordetella pertussis]|nr:Uncharacterised protein [Bordetella pertussis]